MKIICCGLGIWLVYYALNVAKDCGSTWAIVIGAAGIGLIMFSDYTRSKQ